MWTNAYLVSKKSGGKERNELVIEVLRETSQPIDLGKDEGLIIIGITMVVVVVIVYAYFKSRRAHAPYYSGYFSSS
jgi:hypothetical protein